MQSVVDTIKSFFTYLFGLITDFGKLIKGYFDYVIDFWTDFALSIKDFITDLPAILLEYATDFIKSFLDWAGTYCTYCLGGSTLQGTSSSISVFASNLQAAYDALSPCVIYGLTQSGIVGDLQILSCAMVIWSAFRLIGLVRSIV